MSSFVYGTIRFTKALDHAELSKLSFELEKGAIEEGMFLQMGVNIVQRFIFEELSIAPGWDAVEELPFLITDSPVSNVTEELISPDAFGVPDDDWYQMIREHLLAIGRFLETLTGLELVTGVTMYMTEGYGEFEEIRTEPRRLPEVILERYEIGTAPSVKIVVGDVS